MKSWLRFCVATRGLVTRRAYLVTGAGLMAFKLGAEIAVLGLVTGRFVSPFTPLHPFIDLGKETLAGAPSWLSWALLYWQFPFLWVALTLSVRRAASARVSPWMGLLVLVPGINLAVILWLACLPTHTPEPHDPPQELARRRAPLSIGMGITALGLGLLLCALLTNVYFFEFYGATLFVGAPLLIGTVAAYVQNRRDAQSIWWTLSVALLFQSTAVPLFILGGFEGLICLVMAAPIVVPLTLLGACLGKGIAHLDRRRDASLFSALLLFPLLAGLEPLVTAAPERCVQTSVIVNAPPREVWPHVVQFPDLPPATEWIFRLGIASPERARIAGTGVGAVRTCEFTTGDFREPITAWDEPHVLAFDVQDQPPPLIELNPIRAVHAPHLEQKTLHCLRGEFRLVPLPGERTRLEGRTWYRLDMHPQIYWTPWADIFIHRIHQRVLAHICTLAEEKPAGR